jgi:hypothetical protein
MSKHAKSIDSQILRRMRSRGKGHAFTPSDFLDLGTRAAVDQALSRNARAGRIRKVARGLYDVPRDHPVMGRLSPTTDAVVQAVARRTGLRLLPSGAHAANAFGLSDQVPVRAVYSADVRRSRLIKLATAGTVGGDLIQALRWLGRRNVDADTVTRLRRNLSATDKAKLLAQIHHAPAWVADVLRQVAAPEKESRSTCQSASRHSQSP